MAEAESSSAKDFCRDATKLIRENYELLIYLPIDSMLPRLIAEMVITMEETKMIEKLPVNSEKMMYLLNKIILPSLELGDPIKFKTFLEVMKQSSYPSFIDMAKKLNPKQKANNIQESSVNTTDYCSNAMKIIKENYFELLHLPIDSMLPWLFAYNVITVRERQKIETLPTSNQKMEYLLDDIIMLSLQVNVTEKFEIFLEVMEESDDLLLTDMAKKLNLQKKASNIEESSVNTMGPLKAMEGAVIIDQIKDKNQQPTWGDVYAYVVSKYATDWFEIGLELGVRYEHLELIYLFNHMDVRHCLKEMLERWLETDPNPTWKALEVALTNVNRAKLGLSPVDDLYEHGKGEETVSSSEISIEKMGEKQALVSLTDSCNLTDVYSKREECPIKNCKPLSQIFDHHGGKLIIAEHDVTITVPELAVPKGEKVEVKAVASLIGPFKLPEDYVCVSVFVWIGSDYRFKKQVKIRIPHFASIGNSDDNSDIAVLTANTKDQVPGENGAFILQMHKSECNFEVNAYYCDYFTYHFCSNCLAKSRSIYGAIVRNLVSFFSCTRESRTMIYFYVSDNFAPTTIELCICYSVKECLETVENHYEQRKMSLMRLRPWSIPIDKFKIQNFCLSHTDHPGWIIQADTKIEVKELDYTKFSSPEALKEEEKRGTYPPRFCITINPPHSFDEPVNMVFTVTLESDGVVFNVDRKFQNLWQSRPGGKIIKEIEELSVSGNGIGHQLSAPSKKAKLAIASSATDSTHDVLDTKPNMWDIISIVIPRIKAKWEYVAYSMQYSISAIDAFASDSGESCLNLFKDWLSTSHGVTPKTWRTLLDRIKDVDGLQAEAQNIEKKIIEKLTA